VPRGDFGDLVEVCGGEPRREVKNYSLRAAGTFCVTRGAQAVYCGIVATVAVSMPLVDAPWV
jgi:hypothetical protein